MNVDGIGPPEEGGGDVVTNGDSDVEMESAAGLGTDVNGSAPPRSQRAERLAYRRANGLIGECVQRSDDTRGIKTHNIGDMDVPCPRCGALMWVKERKERSTVRNPLFTLCCGDGAVSLEPIRDPPPEIMELLEGNDMRAVTFRHHIRAYNSALAFTSSGAKVDRNLANSRAGVYTYRIQGAVYHRISKGLIPNDGDDASFAQIYIYDTDYQTDRRMQLYPDLDRGIMQTLQSVLARDNPHVRQFISNNEHELEHEATQDFELRIGAPARRDRRYDRPTGSEVAALLIGDGSDSDCNRDIVLRKRQGGLQTVNQLFKFYDSLHYVLLFPYGQEGWSLDFHERTNITMSQYYRYHLMVRPNHRVLQLAGRLTQEFVVDAWAKIEESRLKWCRYNQGQLRADLYQRVASQAADGDRAPGRLIVLPATFTGGPRYMMRLYQDAMAIVRKLGKPDLFITMTCNPKWPEITKYMSPGSKGEAYFQLCCRVFRLKLAALIDRIVNKHLFGDIRGRVHVIEFQKRGLPHAHLLFILDEDSKPTTVEDIDDFVCAELPDPNDDANLYSYVTTHMLHGPCGVFRPHAPCMSDDKCTKKYPRAFAEETQLNSDGYPVYRRRNDGRTFVKGNHVFDNRDVVPYNRKLVKEFNCHINVEVCSSIQSVKYIYKYVYKGHDRVQAEIVGADDDEEVVDEPNDYLDARYVSASEAFWRICEFKLQKMLPSPSTLGKYAMRRVR